MSNLVYEQTNDFLGSDQETPKEIVIYDVRRYGTAGRLYHWVHAAAMMLFISTGWQIHIQQPIFLPMSQVRIIHIALGIFILFWDLVVQIAIITIDGHLKDIIPTPTDVADLIIILLCTLRIIDDKYYPHYDFYDPELGVYVRKYHPGQKFLALADIFAMIIMGATGIALAEAQQPGSTGLMSFFTIFNVLISWLIPLTSVYLRFIHFVIFVFFTLSTFFHIYFALIPQNYSRLRAMISGKEVIKE